MTNYTDGIDDVRQLRELARVVNVMRRGFSHARGGCACSGDGPCAHHAAVVNDLAEAARWLQRAQDDLTPSDKR